MNRDPDQYGRIDDDYDATLLRRLVDDYLLQKFKKISPRAAYCPMPLLWATITNIFGKAMSLLPAGLARILIRCF